MKRRTEREKMTPKCSSFLLSIVEQFSFSLLAIPQTPYQGLSLPFLPTGANESVEQFCGCSFLVPNDQASKENMFVH